MPGLVRKLVIFAAVDGIILQPWHGNGQRNNTSTHSSVQIEYRTSKISLLSPAALEQQAKGGSGLEAHGIVGLLSVASSSYLISITQREQVAQILGKPIYAVTNVAIIPLSSEADASQAITQARESLLRTEKALGDTPLAEVAESETDISISEISRSSSPTDEPNTPPVSQPVGNGIAEDVVGTKGLLSATSWLSRKRLGSNAAFLPGLRASRDQTCVSGDVMLSPINKGRTEEPKGLGISTEAEPRRDEQPPAAGSSDKTMDLIPKLLRYTKLSFASGNFFFAYDYDLTRRFNVLDPKKSHLPLHSLVDPLFFWNRHLLAPLIEYGVHPFVLPLIQGFVGQREFTVASSVPSPRKDEQATEDRVVDKPQANDLADSEAAKHDFFLTLISRRSVQRSGLRYLRRGVDDDGNTANTVETEQILSTASWDPSRKAYSLLQVRGSIPLYFSQSPYSIKPTPVLYRSLEVNQYMFKRHFLKLSERYGAIQAVSLVDKSGCEARLGEAYECSAHTLNETGGIDGSPLRFAWFEFHHECRGMKFEKIKHLVDSLETTLDDFGETVIQNNEHIKEQKGIVRTNCMDCLDRTGVAQCAFGQKALENELKGEGLYIDLNGDSSTQWFNTLWADNGDAISRQYSSTAALKGDYTRTRKRNYRGALNDFGLTLSRYYNNVVHDYFSQACIDYLLGNVSTQVFTEFETEMQSADPGISIQRLRQKAIEMSSENVIGDRSEDLLGGWTMLSPRQPNTLRTLPLEESVLLLTDAAVYRCRFDWNTDQVLSFERVDLRSIGRIHIGPYITSILADSHRDETRNVGLVIVYEDDGGDTALRGDTRSLPSRFRDDVPDRPGSSPEGDLAIHRSSVASWFRGRPGRPAFRFMAFKAPPASNSVTEQQVAVNELESVRSVCEEIERAMPVSEGGPSIIAEQAIISLTEAKKQSGYLEHLVHDMKKLVWA